MQNIPSIIMGPKKYKHSRWSTGVSGWYGEPIIVYITRTVCVIPIQYRLLSSGGHYKISGLLGSGKERVDHTSFDVRLLPYLSACCSFVDSLLLFWNRVYCGREGDSKSKSLIGWIIHSFIHFTPRLLLPTLSTSLTRSLQHVWKSSCSYW